MEQESTHGEEVARECFALVAERFPALRMERDDSGLEVRIPVQPGINHEVVLSFQEPDELHLVVGHFWLEWFPCTRAARSEKYLEAVCGFLGGSYRILEHYRGTSCFKAELQRPSGAQWETVGIWSKLRWPSFARVRYKVLANA